MNDSSGVRGFFRIQLDEEGSIVGDSGWVENTVTDTGKGLYLVRALAASAGSVQISYVAIGSGTDAPATNATTLVSEITENANMRRTLALASSNTKVDFTATFASDLRTNAYTIGNIGLFNASGTETTQLFAGNTYTTSQWATNQAVNVTYSITFT